MPYVNKNIREKLEPIIEELAKNIATEVNNKADFVSGYLNYTFTTLVIEYFNQLDKIHEKDGGIGLCYADYNEVIGALECCKLEFYRRMVTKYEDKKIRQNGDVYKEF